jgi:hypothetical protein
VCPKNTKKIKGNISKILFFSTENQKSIEKTFNLSNLQSWALPLQVAVIRYSLLSE